MLGRISNARLLIIVALIITVGAVVGILLSHSASNPTQVTLPIVTWNETTLSTLQGTPVVLNFWSISCYWCRKQLPYLERVAQQSNSGIRIIAINIGDSAESIQRFFGDYEPAMTIALDNSREAFMAYCLAYNNTRGAIPFTLFVDSEGTVKYVKIGAFSSEAALQDVVREVFGITIP
jgi:thiol-disulfide isomerase/thioredoxin